ncbi:elongation factor G [Chitinispirillales bacterium ANBcel5]|uniref:elongation factor G n=1 Tax=Cellulosispirillum alkaliphilum TaxID=3039283 RepID=UPI002A540618|nr:elongation factor G [Chitinispirillales bacterium ANBcel5]
MKQYEAGSIRNLCLLSHGGVGKTSLMEAISFTSKATSKLGKVDNASSSFDTRADEKERNMTISTHLGFCEWNDCKINLLDTPGFLDLLGEAKLALKVVESAVVMVDAVDGIQVGTELVSRYMDETNVSRMFFVNSMDKDNADFDTVLSSLKENFGSSVAPLAIPIGTGAQFKGVIDLVTREAFEYEREGNGIAKSVSIPQEMLDTVDTLRIALMESIAETDEDLMNKYFEAGELTDEELRKGLAKGVAEGTIFPVLAGSALLNMGVDQLLTKIVNLAPAADSRKEIEVSEGDEVKTVECNQSGPAVAFVFKTLSEEHLGEINLVRAFSGKVQTGHEMFNSKREMPERVGNMYFMRGKDRTDTQQISYGDIGGLLKLKDTHTNDTLVEKGSKYFVTPLEFPEPLVSVAIDSKNKGDEEKIALGIGKLHEEDPSFTYKYHPDIHQSILSAMGDVHIEIILEGLKSRFKVDVDRKPTKISYRETITKPVKYVEYTHKKQSGGAGQYARVFIDLEPQPRGEGYEFIDKIVGGVIDQPFRPSVDKGVKSKMQEGIIAGYPIVDVKVTLVDGKTHPVDSKDVAFQIAGREVFKKAFEMANPILLEPVVELKVTIPSEYTGDIMGDLSSRRGKIGGMEPIGKLETITAKVPESEVKSYSTNLRSLTQGRGFYTKKFSHYEQVPGDVAKKVIEQSKAELQEA